MAASEVEESEVVKTLSVTLGISNEIIAQLASSSEDAATVLLKIKQLFDEHSNKDEKCRSDMASLRRARVDAGLNLSVISETNMPKSLYLASCSSYTRFYLNFNLNNYHFLTNQVCMLIFRRKYELTNYALFYFILYRTTVQPD